MCLDSNGISLLVVLYLSHYLYLNFGALLYVYNILGFVNRSRGNFYFTHFSSLLYFHFINKCSCIIVCYHAEGSMKLNALSCFSHTWFIYNLNTVFINTNTHKWRYMFVTPLDDSFCCQPPLFPFASFPLPTYEISSFTYLEIPLLILWWKCSSTLVPG